MGGNGLGGKSTRESQRGVLLRRPRPRKRVIRIELRKRWVTLRHPPKHRSKSEKYLHNIHEWYEILTSLSVRKVGLSSRLLRLSLVLYSQSDT